jgi:hypothetical protein
MVLQQGKLGVGTDAPQGRFSVADEPHNLEEFPPRAGGFDGDEWYMEGHGTFKACASSYHDSTDYYPGRAFTKSLVVNFGFATLSDGTVARWSGNNGLPNQSSSDPVGFFQGHQGDWLELELPYRIRVKSFQIQTRFYSGSPGDHPKNGFLYGSNNRNNWTQITEFTNLSYTPSQLDGIGAHKAIWNIDSETGFKYLRLLTTQKINGTNAWLMISELRYFGTREQGQSVLHDGQLTLTKNLNVPRIGPPLDADDTPRRDRLVVEYNTSTNPTFEGAVRDTSGRGLDGVLLNSAFYSATNKAFDFSATNNVIYVPSLGPTMTGDVIASMSCWFKLDDANTRQVLMWLGSDAAVSNLLDIRVKDQRIGIAMGNDPDTNMAGIKTGQIINSGKWHHVVGVKATTGAFNSTTASAMFQLYLDGVSVGTYGGLDESGGLNIPTDHDFLSIGAGNETGSVLPMAGQVSNPKLYDTALTAEEVKTLYDMGRCDEGHHVVNFSKTRVGIGLGDGEAPRGVLDVRGDLYLSGNIIRNTSSAKSGGSWIPTYTFEVGGSTLVEDQRHGQYHIINNVLTAVYRARVVSISGAGTIAIYLPGGIQPAGHVTANTIVIGSWASNGDLGSTARKFVITNIGNGYAQPWHTGQTNNQIRLDGSSLPANRYWTIFLSYPVE